MTSSSSQDEQYRAQKRILQIFYVDTTYLQNPKILSSFPRFLRFTQRQILWVEVTFVTFFVCHSEVTFVTFLLNLRIFRIWIFFENILWMYQLFLFYFFKKSLWPIPTTFVCIQPNDSKAIAYLVLGQKSQFSGQF